MPQAFVIGINRYASEQVPSLHCAVNDAEEMTRQLDNAGFDVVTLTDESATKDKINWELEVGLNDRIVDDDDPVVVYWTGHGISDPRLGGGRDATRSTFLLPHDADIRQPLGTALAVHHVWALLDNVRTRRLLVLLDTCFSGAFAGGERGSVMGGKGAPVLPDDLLRMGGHGRVVISACGPSEIAREDRNAGYGFFTKALLSVLAGRVENGLRAIPVTALAANLRSAVQRETRGAQTPFAYHSAQGPDWMFPLPPLAPYRAPMPSWAFVGTSGGVGKTTLAMVTAELLAESGNTVLYIDADIAHYGGTSEWCQRAKTDIGRVRTFSDHVAGFSKAKMRIPSQDLVDTLLDVTPTYLDRHGCGRILLLPAARASDRLFAFELVAEIKERRSNGVCQQILDAAFERGIRHGASCVVVDCGAQFDPLSVNCLVAAHHPVIVAAARAGARDQRDTILSNCAQTVEQFDRIRVETVVNRVPSNEAILQHWGEPGYGRPGMSFHMLPFDPQLFRDWEEGRPNFELGYDELSAAWHEILVASDNNACRGEHRRMLPSEWDRFSKWALWITDHPEWLPGEKRRLTRMLRRTSIVSAIVFTLVVAGAVELVLGTREPGCPTWVIVLLAIGVGLFGLWLLTSTLVIRGVRRRRRLLGDIEKCSVSADELKRWFATPVEKHSRWKVWKASKKAAVEWLYGRVAIARANGTPPVVRERLI